MPLTIKSPRQIRDKSLPKKMRRPGDFVYSRADSRSAIRAASKSQAQ
jgi:hypothetical protein